MGRESVSNKRCQIIVGQNKVFTSKVCRNKTVSIEAQESKRHEGVSGANAVPENRLSPKLITQLRQVIRRIHHASPVTVISVRSSNAQRIVSIVGILPGRIDNRYAGKCLCEQ